MIAKKHAALALGALLGLNIGAVALAASPRKTDDAPSTKLGLEGFVGFPGEARANDDEAEIVEVSRDLSPALSAADDRLLGEPAEAGDWDQATVIAAVVAGFGLTGALVLRSRALQLGQWLGRKGLGMTRDEVQVLAVKALGGNSSVAVVEVFDERLVLGVSAGQISLLTRMDNASARAGAASPSPAPTFGKVLDRAMSDPAIIPPVDPESRELAPPARQAAPAEAAPQAESSGSLSDVLKDVLSRKQQRAAAQRAPLITPSRRADRGQPVRAPGDGLTYNRTLSPESRAQVAAASASSEGAADQVLRKIQTMRRFR